ncbi:MAG: hypothetical protein LBL21_05110 [Rickettsiales bacterium]|jgi:hypothetical protein|nr:hypothetical protein [Rickettsiales bacterium]
MIKEYFLKKAAEKAKEKAVAELVEKFKQMETLDDQIELFLKRDSPVFFATNGAVGKDSRGPDGGLLRRMTLTKYLVPGALGVSVTKFISGKSHTYYHIHFSSGLWKLPVKNKSDYDYPPYDCDASLIEEFRKWHSDDNNLIPIGDVEYIFETLGAQSPEYRQYTNPKTRDFTKPFVPSGRGR